MIEELRKLPESHGFLRGLVAIIGFKQDAVEYDRDERYLGEGKYNKFFGSLQIGLNGVIGFSSFLLTLNLFFRDVRCFNKLSLLISKVTKKNIAIRASLIQCKTLNLIPNSFMPKKRYLFKVSKYRSDRSELLIVRAITAANNNTKPLAASSLKNHLKGFEI